MYQGVVSKDNFGEVLRSISQKRRHGLLEITRPQGVTTLCFAGGKIVEVLDGEKTPLQAVVDRLKRAGTIPEEFEIQEEETYQELLVSLQEQQISGEELSSQVFKRIVKHTVLDHLYSLDLAIGAFYTFRIEMVESDREFSPAIPVGQLLLDLVALEGDLTQCQEAFPSESLVALASASPQENNSEEEEVILQLLTTPLPRDELFLRSLLSLYPFCDALLSLHRRQLVVPTNPAPDLQPTGLSHDDLFAKLDALGEEFEEAALAVREEEPVEVPVAPQERGVKGWVNRRSEELTHTRWVPHVIVVCFIFLSIVSPLIFWWDVLEYYKRF